MKKVIGIIFCLLAINSAAEEQNRQEIPPGNKTQVIPVEAIPADTATAKETPAAVPTSAATEQSQTGATDNRDPGQPVSQFIPTESISADNAVPFPIDI